MKRSIQAVAVVFPALAFILCSGTLKAEESYTVSSGTVLNIRLTKTLSTKRSKRGSIFRGKLIESLFVDGMEVLPAGTYAEGRVTYVKKPGRVKGVGQMRLHLEKLITFKGTEIPIAAPLEGAEGAPGAKVKGEEGTIKGPGSRTGELTTAAVLGGAGATLGGLTAGGSGALYGGGLSAGAVGLRSLFKRGKHLLLPQGTELIFILVRPVTVELEEDSVFDNPNFF